MRIISVCAHYLSYSCHRFLALTPMKNLNDIVHLHCNNSKRVISEYNQFLFDIQLSSFPPDRSEHNSSSLLI